MQLFPHWAAAPKLKICVALGKHLFGLCDLPRAMGLTGHPMVLAQAGKDTEITAILTGLPSLALSAASAGLQTSYSSLEQTPDSLLGCI